MGTGEPLQRDALVFAFALRQVTRGTKDSALANMLNGHLTEPVTAARVRAWKDAREVPNTRDLQKIATALGVPPATLTTIPRHHVAVVFAANLFRHQKERGWDQRHLGRVLGIGPPAVSRLLSGAHQPVREQVEQYAASLGVEPDEFFVHPLDLPTSESRAVTRLAIPRDSAAPTGALATYDPAGPAEPGEWAKMKCAHQVQIEILERTGYEWAIIAAHNYRLPPLPQGFSGEPPRLKAAFYYSLIMALVTGTESAPE